MSQQIDQTERERVKALFKGFPEGTFEAYFAFRQDGDLQALDNIIYSFIEFYLPTNVTKPEKPLPDDTELVDTLGLDSLGMVEMVFQIEDILDVNIPDEDTQEIRTTGDLKKFLQQAVLKNKSASISPEK